MRRRRRLLARQVDPLQAGLPELFGIDGGFARHDRGACPDGGEGLVEIRFGLIGLVDAGARDGRGEASEPTANMAARKMTDLRDIEGAPGGQSSNIGLPLRTKGSNPPSRHVDNCWRNKEISFFSVF